jgi:hypothetical protein
MMKKVLALLLVLGMTSLANATIMDVVMSGAGSLGHAGTLADPMVVGETVEIKIVINADPNPTWYSGGSYPVYDGYWLSVMDVDLTASGSAITGPGAMTEKGTGLATKLKHNTGFGAWAEPEPAVVNNAIAYLSGTAAGDGIQGLSDLVWNLVVTVQTQGVVNVDLRIKGLNQYSEYANSVGGTWITMTEADLGDLTIIAPEPMTIALLGLGGLFLRRRR